MEKVQRIIQKLNSFLLLLLLLLMGVSLAQGFLNGNMDMYTFMGTLAIPWVVFLGFWLICAKVTGKRTREYLEDRKKSYLIEGIGAGIAILSMLVIAFCFREKFSFTDKGWVLLEAGKILTKGELAGAAAGIADYICANPGQMLYGWLLAGMSGIFSDYNLGGFLLQLILYGLVLTVTYFCIRKIYNPAAGIIGIYLVGGTLIWKKTVLWADGKLFYLLFVMCTIMLLSQLFVKRDRARRFGMKDLGLLVLAAVTFAFATVCEFRNIFMIIPYMLVILFSEKGEKHEAQESILESRGVQCLVFFFVSGILTITLGLILALGIQHTLLLMLPTDVSFFRSWLTSPLDGVLNFFYKLEGMCMGRESLAYEYGFVLSMVLMAFVQTVIQFVKEKKTGFFPVYLLLCYILVELVLYGETGAGAALVVMLCMVSIGLFYSIYEVIVAKQQSRDEAAKAADTAMAVSQVAKEGPVQVKDFLEEKLQEQEVALANNEEDAEEPEIVEEPEKELEPETEPELVEELEIKAEPEESDFVEEPETEPEFATEPEESEVLEDAKESEAEEVAAYQEKIEKLEAVIVGQQMRISRMEEMMKEQRLLAKKRERRLRQELAIARNKNGTTAERTKR